MNRVSKTSSTQSVKPLWRQLLSETRTRILLLHGLLLLLIAGLSIPIFRYLLFANVDARVKEDLIEEQESFLAAYENWESLSSEQTIGDLKTFIQTYLDQVRPEDDNFQIVLIDGLLSYSNPAYLIEPLRSDSELFSIWQAIKQSTTDTYSTGQTEIGQILYIADPLILEGEQRGTFISAHSSAGERQEALVGVYLLMQIMAVVFFIALALSWLSAGKIMAPISTLARTARSISESDLTQRIPTPRSNGELSELTHVFNAMMDRIQAAFDSQRKFINDAGHELRTPITIIQGHLELLDDDPQERQETMEIVMDELDRMGRLVSDLILLAKSERPNFLQLETITLLNFTELVFTKATALTDRNWQLSIDPAIQAQELTDQVQILGDRQKLTGALLNLLRNAAQHTQADDMIELGCRLLAPQNSQKLDSQGLDSQGLDSQNLDSQGPDSQGPDSQGPDLQGPDLQGSISTKRQVQIWVSDTGTGISAEEQQHIFDRFARGRHRRAEGSGLGLAIVSAVVEAHGGRIELESKPGVGSTFRVLLPLKKSSSSSS